MDMKIEKQSTKNIKPSVPTPPTLRRYKLGLIDEFVPSINVNVVLFFSTNSNNHDHPMFIIAQLEKSLEKTLTRFYPLCGRYDNKTQTIDCNDQGAEFISSKVNIKLENILVSEGDVHFIDEFIPSKSGVVDQLNGPLFTTQVTTFECGSLALGVSASHMIVDACTLCTFLNEWAFANRETNGIESTGRPGFDPSQLLPARGLQPFPLPDTSQDMSTKYIKYSFNESVISNLKANRKNSTGQWSKVQSVSAIIWKALMAVDRATYSCRRESVLTQTINLRGRMASTIPKNSCGNIWALFSTKATTDETTEDLTNLLNDSVKKTVSELSKAYHEREEGQMMILNGLIQLGSVDLESTNVSGITSWCKFPFYEADFGFGKPTWVVPRTIPIPNSVLLIDDSDGNGVEAYVFLDVKDISVFEEALELKAFTA
ncbi:pelargonidin 3-O-(6-caffeoylglucoside) 5-O-(6-O-malonylglucoside) 4'''-malonyltransferase-like [Rutidosis leptorrhynchoides]|uniref:pelargonidin 3-O-(6-caffeoylglucoside) 5-O-(6-O-malonylglucoside) 4'''-malonyltransferase-like n=1 Tax=Rutidosis leptorrhynchoides TaxID=125765 RepID=UPI003A98F3B6